MAHSHEYGHIEHEGEPVGLICRHCLGTWPVLTHEVALELDRRMLAAESRLFVLERNMAATRPPEFRGGS